MINVQHGTDHAQWNRFVTQEAGEHTSLLQTWEWGMFQEQAGRTVYRFAILDGEQLIGVMQCIVMPLPLGRSYLFSPRGPLFRSSVTDASAVLEEALKHALVQESMQKHAVVFLRCEPMTTQLQPFLQTAKRVKDVEPAWTQVIDLSLSEDALLAAMKMRARYNVRLATKKGVQIQWVSKADQPNWAAYADQFWNVIAETGQRHQFRTHSKAYYQMMMEVLGNAGVLELCIARHENDVLAMNMMMTAGDTMTYLHSGATRTKSNLKAPHLMQWECMRHAKQNGLRWYDLFGIAPEGATEHPLAGVTAFKQSLGGQPVQFPGTYEVAFSSPWYTIYRIVKSLRS